MNSNRSQKWIEAAKLQQKRLDPESIAQAAKEYEDFLKSRDGKIALNYLLYLANETILLGKKPFPHPIEFQDVYLLTGGPTQGNYVVTKDVEGTLIPANFTTRKEISTEQAVTVAVVYWKIDPENFMSWLYEQLDSIADSILKQSDQS